MMIRKSGLSLGMLTLVVSSAHAQTPQEILTKAEAVYKSAKTYQADYSVKLDSDIMNTLVTGNMQVEGTKYRVESTTQDKYTTLQQMMVCDGKTVTVYFPTMRQYSRSPFKSSGQITPLTRIRDAKNESLKKLPAVIAGVPVYVVQSVVPGTQANLPGTIGTTTLAIDKQTYRLVRVINLINKTKFVEKYLNETFNAPLPPQTFVFTPPAGAKPLK